MTTTTGKRYTPDFTQLPFGFVNNNLALQTLMRTKGLEYLAIYIAIQDRMANHSDDDFTLSFNEMLFECQSFLQLFTTPVETIKGWLEELIDANIIESRYVVNRYTEMGEERYCIASVQDILQSTREAWFSKIINPRKLPKADKEQLKRMKESINDTRKKINTLNKKKNNLHIQLKLLLDTEKQSNMKMAGACQEEILECETELKSLQIKLHTLENRAQILLDGGDEIDE